MTEAEATTMNKGVGTDPWVEPAPIIITQPAPVILLKAEKPPGKIKTERAVRTAYSQPCSASNSAI